MNKLMFLIVSFSSKTTKKQYCLDELFLVLRSSVDRIDASGYSDFSTHASMSCHSIDTLSPQAHSEFSSLF